MYGTWGNREVPLPLHGHVNNINNKNKNKNKNKDIKMAKVTNKNWFYGVVFWYCKL